MLLELPASKGRSVRPAIVVNKDGSGNPGYRVKLVFSWLDDRETTLWARIATVMGGLDRAPTCFPRSTIRSSWCSSMATSTGPS
jgi:hypothetical protein